MHFIGKPMDFDIKFILRQTLGYGKIIGNLKMQ